MRPHPAAAQTVPDKSHSLLHLGPSNIIALAKDVISSHVLDTLLKAEEVPRDCKRNFMLSLLGHMHLLADDKISSRVADTIWYQADTYLKVRSNDCTVIKHPILILRQTKIVKSLIPHEEFLIGSEYGRFLYRKAQFQLFKRRPDEWREVISQQAMS